MTWRWSFYPTKWSSTLPCVCSAELDASRLWITAYAQDVSTYIVSRRLIDEGGYEVNNSLSSLVTFGQPETLQPAMEDRIVDCVKAMLPEDFQQPKAAAHTREKSSRIEWAEQDDSRPLFPGSCKAISL